jgi:hypothetical protein
MHNMMKTHLHVDKARAKVLIAVQAEDMAQMLRVKSCTVK